MCGYTQITKKSKTKKKIGNRKVVATKVGTVFLGFVVDHVVGLMNLQQESFEDSHPNHWDGNLIDYLSGIYKEDDVYFGICDMKKMLNDKRFTEEYRSYN